MSTKDSDPPHRGDGVSRWARGRRAVLSSGMQLRSSAPEVKLTKFFTTPFDNAIATARTCYSARIITDDDVRKNVALRNKIAESTYKAGHHTTLQHAHFEFTLDNVSRHALWSFFHAHPFYNSEQVSQRYVEVKPGRVLKPSFAEHQRSFELEQRYDACVERQMANYHRLNALLEPVVERLYFGIFPARKRMVVDKRWTSAMQKRAQEVSRYVLPLGTHAYLYHTVSGLTLHRYHRLARSHDCPTETQQVVDQMIALVRAQDPDFMLFLEEPLPTERSLDDQLQRQAPPRDVAAFTAEFDASLEGKTAKLTDLSRSPERVIGSAVRETLGLLQKQLSDVDATRALLDPLHNKLLGESLQLLTLQKTSRALELVHVTFRKKLSHSADSQEQRHRMTPGARPILWTQIDPHRVDYVLPIIFRENDAAEARDVFEQEMRDTFADAAFLADAGVSPEAWQYLLPNAVPIRFTETGSLLDHHHKWTTRLCYNAQEEIWRATLDEVEQVNEASPVVAEFLLPPCGQRLRAGVGPYCPEGERFCGQPVWSKPRSGYLRVL
jgi:thymidylate synthase ThyX